MYWKYSLMNNLNRFECANAFGIFLGAFWGKIQFFKEKI